MPLWQDGVLATGESNQVCLVQGRTGDAHQYTGTPCSHSGGEELCQEQVEYRNPDKYQQQYSNGIRQPLRRDSLQCVEQISVRPVEVGHGEEHFLRAEHLPGVKNIIADEESRMVRDRCDWMILPRAFAHLQQTMGPLEVDMFASRLTHHLPRFSAGDWTR